MLGFSETQNQMEMCAHGFLTKLVFMEAKKSCAMMATSDRKTKAAAINLGV